MRKGRRIELPCPAIENKIAARQRIGARLIASCGPEFPKSLVSLNHPPPLLTVPGNRALARPDAVAVAVLGGGTDHIRPPPHERLYREIAEPGLIGSEEPDGIQGAGVGFAPAQPDHHRPCPGHGRGRGGGAVRLADLGAHRGRAEPRGEGSAGLAAGSARLRHLWPDPAGCRARAAMRRTYWKYSPDYLRFLWPPRPCRLSLRNSWMARCGRTRPPASGRRSPLRPMPIDEIARAAGPNAAQCNAALLELGLGGEALSLPGGLLARAG